MPIGKDKPSRRIDKPAAYRGGGAVEATTPDYAPPAPKSIPVPEDLALTTGIGRSSAAPTAYISATWSRPYGTDPQSYRIQYSTSNTFPDGTTTTLTALNESAMLDGLKPNTTYYVRVAAVFRSIQSGWSATVSQLTASDTTPAAQPTALVGTWIGTGDLQITFTPPTDDNYKDTEFRIYASNGGTLYRTIYSRSGPLFYRVAENLQDTSGTGDPSLYVLARSRTFSNVTNNTSVPALTTTKSAPTAPTLSQSWNGDTGAAGADLKISWTADADAAYYLLALNGLTAQRIPATTYTYTFAHNVADNTTADPSVTYSLKAVDGLGQQSTNVTGTATNVAPATTAITIAAGFSAIAVSATPSTAADFRDYTFRVIKDTVTLVTYRSTSPDVVYKATAGGSYQVGVKVNDLFGQQSTETVSSAVVLDALTIEELRSELTYTSDDGQADADLNKLKDNDTTTAATAHASSAVAWRTITAIRPQIDRYGQITLFTGGIAAGTLKVYFGLSLDGVTWTWYAGALQPTGATGQNTTLVAYGVEATAQTNALTLAATTAYRFEIPALTEARYIALKHRDTTGAYNFREYYPRRKIQTDDLDAESIRSINIGADQVLADHIFVLSLSAIVADIGQLTITNPAGPAWIYQGTGTGASPTTGLKIYNVGGIGKISGYNATVEQVALDTDGKIKAGAGSVLLDASGLTISQGASDVNLIKFKQVGDTGNIGELWAFRSPSGAAFDEFHFTRRDRNAAHITELVMVQDSISLSIDGGASAYSFNKTEAGFGENIHGYADATIAGGLNIGTATGAASGTAAMTAADAATTSTVAWFTLGHNSSATPGAGFGGDISLNLNSSTTDDTAAALIRTSWVTATHASRAARVRFFVYDTAARTVMDMEASGSAPMIGFLGAAAIARQSIGAAAPAGGTGAAAGAYDTAAHRDAAITLLNNIRTALLNNGLCTT